MARHYIGYTARGATTLRNVYRDGDTLLLWMDENEVRKLTLDFSAFLDTGETIAGVAIAADSVTVTESTTSPVIILTISAPTGYGEIKATVTFTGGAVVVEHIMAVLNDRSRKGPEADYRLPL
jgi:hypothetical protein